MIIAGVGGGSLKLISDDGGGSVIFRTVRGLFGPAGLATFFRFPSVRLVTCPCDNGQSVAFAAGGEDGFAHIPAKRGHSRGLAAPKLC